MANYITTADFKHFQPMNANFGLFPPLENRIRNKKEKNEAIANRALDSIERFKKEHFDHINV
jgi:methylenetetrahydrofolate--tRNA-(uracil-5-)-methyltransferase